MIEIYNLPLQLFVVQSESKSMGNGWANGNIAIDNYTTLALSKEQS